MATCAAIVNADLPDQAAEDSLNLLPALLGKAPREMIRPYTLYPAPDDQFGSGDSQGALEIP